MDDRSKRQKKADEALTAAIAEAVAAYRVSPSDESSTIVGNFIVIGRTLGFRADGREYDGRFKLFKDGGIDVDWDAAIGMCRRAELEIMAEYQADDDDV